MYVRISTKLKQKTEELSLIDEKKVEEVSTTTSDQPIVQEQEVKKFEEKKIRNIRFVYFSKTATNVSIIGNFNNWLPQKLTKVGSNQWEIILKIQEGKYHYNFIVDGKIILDPNNKRPPEMSSEGFLSSVLDLQS